MKQRVTRKPWTCSECGRELPAGTTAHVGRYGIWVRRDGFGVIHMDLTGTICTRCYLKRGAGEGDDAA